MRPIEADGIRLTHLSSDTGELAALCGVSPFPSRWFQPTKVNKILCRMCLAKRRR